MVRGRFLGKAWYGEVQLVTVHFRLTSSKGEWAGEGSLWHPNGAHLVSVPGVACYQTLPPMRLLSALMPTGGQRLPP